MSDTTHTPAARGRDPGIDVVPGDVPVPITVWRTARTGDDRTTTALSGRLAYRLIAAYSRPGDTVIDLTDGHGLTTAGLRGGRRHHPAWFTTASALIIGPTTLTDPPDGASGDDGAGDAVAWFGDDLTDTDPPPATAAASPAGHRATVRAATSLIVASWPLDPHDAVNRRRLARLLSGCGEILRPGGCLVLVVGLPVATAATPEDFGPIITAASTVGLGYLQHIVSVAADTDRDEFTYYATDEEFLALSLDRGEEWSVAHLRVHADLLVFTRQGGDSRG
jgi:SAM-dependent methyltransferase